MESQKQTKVSQNLSELHNQKAPYLLNKKEESYTKRLILEIKGLKTMIGCNKTIIL